MYGATMAQAPDSAAPTREPRSDRERTLHKEGLPFDQLGALEEELLFEFADGSIMGDVSRELMRVLTHNESVREAFVGYAQLRREAGDAEPRAAPLALGIVGALDPLVGEPPSEVVASHLRRWLWLRQFELEGFRAFGRSQTIGELDHVNVFIGANNVGKSCLLAALHRLSTLRPDSAPVLAPHAHNASALSENVAMPRFLVEDVARGSASLTCSLTPFAGIPRTYSASVTRPEPALRPRGRGGGNVERGADGREYVPAQLRIDPEKDRPTLDAPRVEHSILYVPSLLQSRRGAEHGPGRVYTGSRLARDVASWQVPRVGEREADLGDLRRFESMASHILGEEVRVWTDVSGDGLGCVVSISGEAPEPLEALGDGVYQALTIAGAATLLGRGILLLEEPDQGLHPRAQRNLASALLGCRSIQTLMTTHSNHVIDRAGDGVHVFQVSRGTGTTTAALVMNDQRRRMLIDDLGARPSSVLFVNATVWVEGPSDVKTISHWLDIHTGLLGGVDYALVPYQGDGIGSWAWLDDGDSAPEQERVTPDAFLVHDRDGHEKVDGAWAKTRAASKDKSERLERLERALGERFKVLECRELENLHTPECVEAYVQTQLRPSPQSRHDHPVWAHPFRFTEPRLCAWDTEPLGKLIAWEAMCAAVRHRMSLGPQQEGHMDPVLAQQALDVGTFEGFCELTEEEVRDDVIRQALLEFTSETWVFKKKVELARFSTNFYDAGQRPLSAKAIELVKTLERFIQSRN